jgi:hypothetical protein
MAIQQAYMAGPCASSLSWLDDPEKTINLADVQGESLDLDSPQRESYLTNYPGSGELIMQTKKMIRLIAFLVLIVISCSGPVIPVLQNSNTVFQTPEDVIIHYFEGLAQSDMDRILAACAILEMAEKFRFDLYTERVGGFEPVLSLSPTNHPLYVESNKLQLFSQASNRVKMFTFGLLSPETGNPGNGFSPLDSEQATRFVQEVDPQRLSGLELKEIGLPDKTLMSSAEYMENAAEIAKIYGADESTERVALFLFEQNYFFVGFTILRYGENWKISSQTSPLADISSLGMPQPTTVEEFEQMINRE